MDQILFLIFAVGAVILLLHLPAKIEIHDLPELFNDEPIASIECRPDLAAERNADQSFQLRTLRTCITYSTQRNAGVLTERFEITFRGRPGPILELDDGLPIRFGKLDSKEEKKYFLPKEVNDIRAFVHHVRVCVGRHRTPMQ